jgi:CRISPR-associated endonuclease/helicase Cas3
MTVAKRFASFFAAVNDGRSPYPWQTGLVTQLAQTGRWPTAISAPTGAGKSAVIDAHVFLVAEQARAGRTVARSPRRLVLISPRRVLVDDQHERAQRISGMLADPERHGGGILSEMADALRRLITSDEDPERISPLGVTRLRGGVLLDTTWRLDPAQCQIICTTPQMWGSRLLLRGFRGTRRSRNLETGLLAHDVAVVIDEAHLHGRLVGTARRVASWTDGLQVVAMSATPRHDGGVGLTEDDLAHEELAARVRAPKALDLVEVDDWNRDARGALISRARELAGNGTVGVFVNTVATALAVAGELGREGGSNVVLICGRMRPADLARIRAEHPGLLDSRGNDDVDYLVTTQSLEVGVDLDLPAIVSELAPASALAQRMGRLNRSGRRQHAVFSVVVPADLGKQDPSTLDRSFAPYRGQEIGDAAQWLESLGGDASPERISSVPLILSDEPVLPALTRVELETLAMTGVPLSADPDPAFYVAEPQESDQRTVSVAARDHLLPSGPDDSIAPGTEAIRQMLEVLPPRAHELAGMSIGKEVEALLDRVQGCWIVRTEEGGRAASLWPIAGGLRDGDVLVLPAEARVLVQGVIGGGRGGAAAIDDVMAARDPHEGPPDQVVRLPAREVKEIVDNDLGLGRRASRNALAEMVARAGAGSAADRLRRHRRLADLQVVWCVDELDGEADGLLVLRSIDRAGQVPATTTRADEDAPITVDSHGAAVRARMEHIIEALEAPMVDVVRDELLLAAELHDEGKRHPRFQARMGADPAQQTGPLAKPVLGYVADGGDGWRHEQLSTAIASAATDRVPLVVALVAAHHGHGRPLFNRDAREVLEGWVPDDPRIAAEAEWLFGDRAGYELLRSRLHDTLSIHRLAYLEALVRCADMQVSREGG